ncbi:hypothetical protein BHE74_00029869 [Ensete ventricosum]|nr:hypothetical protein BHE74_00029869 [Ensete ventricosum]
MVKIIDAFDANEEGTAEQDIIRGKPAGPPVSSRLPLMLPDKVQRSKVYFYSFLHNGCFISKVSIGQSEAKDTMHKKAKTSTRSAKKGTRKPQASKRTKKSKK